MFGGFPKDFDINTISNILDNYSVLKYLDPEGDLSILKFGDVIGSKDLQFFCGDGAQNHFHKQDYRDSPSYGPAYTNKCTGIAMPTGTRVSNNGNTIYISNPISINDVKDILRISNQCYNKRQQKVTKNSNYLTLLFLLIMIVNDYPQRIPSNLKLDKGDLKKFKSNINNTDLKKKFIINILKYFTEDNSDLNNHIETLINSNLTVKQESKEKKNYFNSNLWEKESASFFENYGESYNTTEKKIIKDCVLKNQDWVNHWEKLDKKPGKTHLEKYHIDNELKHCNRQYNAAKKLRLDNIESDEEDESKEQEKDSSTYISSGLKYNDYIDIRKNIPSPEESTETTVSSQDFPLVDTYHNFYTKKNKTFFPEDDGSSISSPSLNRLQLKKYSDDIIKRIKSDEPNNSINSITDRNQLLEELGLNKNPSCNLELLSLYNYPYHKSLPEPFNDRNLYCNHLGFARCAHFKNRNICRDPIPESDIDNPPPFYWNDKQSQYYSSLSPLPSDASST